jgi:hypothetical protein
MAKRVHDASANSGPPIEWLPAATLDFLTYRYLRSGSKCAVVDSSCRILWANYHAWDVSEEALRGQSILKFFNPEVPKGISKTIVGALAQSKPVSCIVNFSQEGVAQLMKLQARRCSKTEVLIQTWIYCRVVVDKKTLRALGLGRRGRALS